MNATLSRFIPIACGLAVLLSAAGCTPNDGKDMHIAQLEDKLRELEGKEREWITRINQANADRDRAIRDRDNYANQLAQAQSEIQRLRAELAAAKSMPQQPQQPQQQLPKGWVGEGNVVWTNITEDILFDPGKADLKASGRAKLQEISQQIKSNFPDLSIWVVGHTDSDPVIHSKNLWKDNLDLSLGRGRVVTLELLKFGLDGRSVVAGGQGEFNPLRANDSPANRAINRRVQIIAIPKPKGTAISAVPVQQGNPAAPPVMTPGTGTLTPVSPTEDN